MDNGDIICWPDGTWCYVYELQEYTHMSDDCRVIKYGSTEWHTLASE